MTSVAEAFVTLRPDTKGFKGDAERDIGGTLKTIATGAAAAFAAVKVKDFLSGAISEAREAIKVTAQTEQVIKSTGGAAHLSAKDFETLAGAISAKVGIDDEAIQSAENLLATFTNVRNEVGKGNNVFDQATQAIVDMSAVQGDLQSNSLLVGKALQDPVLGMTALQRVGVRLSETQKQQIKDFVALGDKASAQKVILKELGTEFGGQAEAQATAGDKLNVVWGNFQETVGKKLVPVMEKVSEFLIEHQNLLVPVAAVIGTVLVGAFTAWAVSAAAAAAATLAAAAPFIALGVGIAALVAGIVYAYEHFETFRVIVNGFIEFLQGVVQGALTAVAAFWRTWGEDLTKIVSGYFKIIQTEIETVLNVVRDVINIVLALISGDWGKAWDGVKKLVSDVWEGIKGVVQGALMIVQGYIDAALRVITSAWSFGWNAIKSFLGDVWNGIRDAVVRGKDDVVEFMRRLPGQVLDALAAFPGQMVQLGKDIILGLIHGVESLAGDLFEGIKNVVTNAVDGVKDFLGIGSPSKLFFEFGQNTIQGYINGMKDRSGSLLDTVREIFSAAAGGVTDILSANDALRANHEAAQEVIKAEQALKDLRASGTATADELRAAEERLSDAKRHHLETELRLQQVGQSLLDMSPATQEMFEQIARRAGYTADEIRQLTHDYQQLAAGIAAANNAAAAQVAQTTLAGGFRAFPNAPRPPDLIGRLWGDPHYGEDVVHTTPDLIGRLPGDPNYGEDSTTLLTQILDAINRQTDKQTLLARAG